MILSEGGGALQVCQRQNFVFSGEVKGMPAVSTKAVSAIVPRLLLAKQCAASNAMCLRSYPPFLETVWGLFIDRTYVAATITISSSTRRCIVHTHKEIVLNISSDESATFAELFYNRWPSNLHVIINSGFMVLSYNTQPNWRPDLHMQRPMPNNYIRCA